MKLGNIKIFLFILFFFKTSPIFSADKIETVPLINLENLSPTFEEEKDELEKIDEKNTILKKSDEIIETSKSEKNDKIYINLKALDKNYSKNICF